MIFCITQAVHATEITFDSSKHCLNRGLQNPQLGYVLMDFKVLNSHFATLSSEICTEGFV